MHQTEKIECVSVLAGSGKYTDRRVQVFKSGHDMTLLGSGTYK